MAVQLDYSANRKGIGEMLKSVGVLLDLERRARRVASAAGPGHEVDAAKGRTRARAQVRTSTPAAARRERETHALTAALDAAR